MNKVVEIKNKVYVVIKTLIRVQYCASVKYQQPLNVFSEPDHYKSMGETYFIYTGQKYKKELSHLN